MPVHWETDRGLRLRMGVAMGLVLVLPVAFVYAFVFLANTVGVALLEFATERPWTGRFYVEPWVVLGGVAVGFAAQYGLGERTALRAVGARRVERAAYPDLHDAVTRLAQTVDVPAPDVAVARTEVPNAFTVGRRPSAKQSAASPAGS